MTDVLLVLNAGSSSLKFSIFESNENLVLLESGQVSGIGTNPVFCLSNGDKTNLGEESGHAESLAHVVGWVKNHGDWKLVGAGHRVVHGGCEFSAPVKLDKEVADKLDELEPLAPLHQPHNVRPIRYLLEHYPDIVQTGCFDTAFHMTNPSLNKHFAIPKELFDKGIKRYGFHGTSYQYISEQLKELHPKLYEGNVVVAHLGNGASLCAVKNGKSVDTTMGMTPVDGLPMGTRCGAIDVGVVFHLIKNMGMTIEEVEHMLVHESGLKGLSGVSNDVKELRDVEDTNKDAALALEYFELKVAQNIAAMAAAMGGIDAIVFTGGIGEHDKKMKENVSKRLEFLNSEILVIPTNEELMIAKSTYKMLG